MEEVTGALLALNRSREKRKRRRLIITALDGKPAVRDTAVEVDAVAVQSRRSSCFQSAPLEAE
jgi:hypothetical protein